LNILAANQTTTVKKRGRPKKQPLLEVLPQPSASEKSTSEWPLQFNKSIELLNVSPTLTTSQIAIDETILKDLVSVNNITDIVSTVFKPTPDKESLPETLNTSTESEYVSSRNSKLWDI